MFTLTTHAEAGSYIAAKQEFQTLIEREAETVKSPEHYSRLYDHGTKTAKTMLVMHGLHESPKYMESLSQHYFNKGYNVLSILLAGHMRKDPAALNHVKASEWIIDAEVGLQIARGLGDSVEILGYSTGAELGVYLALEYPQEIKALYLIAPGLALSQQIYWSGEVVGQTPFNTNVVCNNVNSILCKIFMKTSVEIQEMVQEGIEASPAAGLQVQALINQTLQKFPAGLPNENRTFTERAMNTYNRLTLPIAMVNSEADDVVDWSFNDKFIRQYQGPNTHTLFPKSEGVLHIYLNKDNKNGFKLSKRNYDPAFAETISILDQLEQK